MCCASQFRGSLNRVIAGRLGWLTLAYGVVLALHYTLATKHGVHAAEAWFSAEEGVFDWPFLQKMTLCFVLLEFGRKFQAVLYPKLRYIADISFGIYFLHAFFIKLIRVFVPEQWLAGGLFSFVTIFSVVMLCCVASCYVAQRIFGRHSRQLIGC